jgi:hypothetical protein
MVCTSEGLFQPPEISLQASEWVPCALEAEFDKIPSMRGDRETVDVVVHADDFVSLNLAAARIERNRIVLRGPLIDPEIPIPVDVTIDTALSDELAEGAHVERSRGWSVEIGGEMVDVSWQVETIDLGDGFVLHDARAKSESASIRAFGIEDLAATLGVAAAAGIAGYLLWRSKKREEEAVRSRDAEIARCYEKGGWPEIDYGIADAASLSPERLLQLKSSGQYKVICRPGPDRANPPLEVGQSR